MRHSTRKKRRWLIPILLVAALIVVVGALSLLQKPEAAKLPAETPVPEATAVPAEETQIPTAEPTQAPTPTPPPTPEPTPEPTAAPEVTATPEVPEGSEQEEDLPITSLTGGVGSYIWKNGDEEWSLTLRDNGTYTIVDGAGQLHTGESWTVEDNGTVTCGPTDLYAVDFSFSGGCSCWRFMSGELCEPVAPRA